jgi:uncharacterized protein (TIGR04255 family)
MIVEARCKGLIAMGRKYKSSPIVEVICEFQFEPNPEWDLAVLGRVYERLKESFPVRKQVAQVNAVLEGMNSVPFVTNPLMQFLKDDTSALIQVGQGLLVVNHLGPYTSWEEFQLQVREGLQAYLAVTNSDRFRQVVLHYINRIEFEDNVRLKDYLNFRPFLGEAFSQDVPAFVVGVQLPSDGSDATTNLRLETLDAGDRDAFVVMLDISYTLSHLGEIELLTVFERLKGAQNKIGKVFEACITDKLRHRFEEVKDR